MKEIPHSRPSEQLRQLSILATVAGVDGNLQCEKLIFLSNATGFNVVVYLSSVLICSSGRNINKRETNP